MAGLGRRTHFRKYLTDAVLFDLPEPASNERIGKVVATRGSNQFDVLIAAGSKEAAQENRDKRTVLAILPTKFRKLVWLKRNDYVIAQTVENQEDETAAEEQEECKKSGSSSKSAAKETKNEGIRYMITHILYKDQIQHLISKDLWPGHDPNFVSSDARAGPDSSAEDVQDDGIVYQDNYHDNSDDEGSENDADLFVNTNRIANLVIDDSSSSEEED